ncbi:autotransporter outer membrane beta-barrel domain-containing protein [Chryseolinea soli]|uniref:Outer membrane protein beta-barrel domain-containing protein n=1 Tax=Chryseolinea soli TaxID=2321403 RepID=A0A385SHT0_9BACT|nr:autotransporter outer membrane beta-barrel domain-containing protein [Chryseolinea soli]AYB30016.1 hypothetical protein D4L85_05235 [Chryseolinea soli]
MKKIFFLLLFAPILVKAQFNKGDVFLGGNISGAYSHSAPTGNDNGSNGQRYTGTSYTLSPTIGFFTSQRFALGGNIQYGRSSSDSKNDTNRQENHTATGSVSVLGRYFFPFNEKFSFALTGNIFYARSKSDSEYSGPNFYQQNTNKSYSMGVVIKPTFLYFPSTRWGFEASIGSLQFVHDQSFTTHSKSDEFSTTLGTLSLGLAYYFRKSQP